MKKTLITLSILGAISFTSANYTLKYPLEQAQGGSLPSGTISIKNITPQAPIENWMPTTPFYTEWVNDGEPFDCTNWSPDPITVALGETFPQTATDCQQQQIRTRQDQEIETNTSTVRTTGDSVIENQRVNTIETREAIGTLETTECLYDRHGNTLEQFSKIGGGTLLPADLVAERISRAGNTSHWFRAVSWNLNVLVGGNIKFTIQNGYRYTLGERFESTEFTVSEGSTTGYIWKGYYQICREKI